MAEHCIHCGSAHRPAAKICPTCGRALAADDEATDLSPRVPGPLVPPSEAWSPEPTHPDPPVPPSIATPHARPYDPTTVGRAAVPQPTAVHRVDDPPPPLVGRPRRSGTSPGFVVIAVLLVIAAGVGAYLVTSGDGGSGSPTTTAAEAAGLLTPSTITASAERSSVALPCTGEEILYTADKLVDGDENTGWGAGADDGTGESVVIEFAAPVHLTQIALTPGYTKFGPRADTDCTPVAAFPRNRFVSRVRYTFDDGSSLVQTFQNEGSLQPIPVDVVTRTVTLTILETVLPAGADDDTILSELRFMGVAT